MQLDRQRIMNDAPAGAVAFEAQQQSRGIPPLETAAAAAMLIGLDEDVVHPASAPVHGDLDSGGGESSGKRGAGEPAALVGIEDFRLIFANAVQKLRPQAAQSALRGHPSPIRQLERSCCHFHLGSHTVRTIRQI